MTYSALEKRIYPFFCVILFLLFSSSFPCYAQEKPLFKVIKKVQKSSADNAALSSKHLVKADKNIATKIARGKEFLLNLPDLSGQPPLRLRAKSKRSDGDNLVVTATLPRNQGDATFLISALGELKSGSIVSRKDHRIRNFFATGDGTLKYETYDSSKFPGCATGDARAVSVAENEESSRGVLAGSSSAADGTATIDVLVLWSPQARAAAGSASAIQAIAAQAVAETNQAYINSGVLQRVNLVYSAETMQSEDTASFNSNLDRLTNVSDGFYDEAHSLRAQYGADEVVFLVNNAQYCGVAWLMTNVSTGFAPHAFAVVSRGCAVGYYSFAHELGHNMGSMHDVENSGGSGGAYPYSFGYRFNGTNGVQYRTIMAYAPGTRIQYFSNPEVSFSGVPAGSATANNALSLNNTAPTVAAFRAAPITTCMPSAPGLTISPSSQSATAGSAKTYTITVKNNDAGPCDSATFTLSAGLPTAWTSALTSSSMMLAPQASGSTSINVTSDVNAQPGTYNISVDVTDALSALHNRSGGMSYQVLLPDVVAPTAPSALKASAKRGAVSLSWLASSDNVGVTGYQIFRNGVMVAQTTSLSFKNNGLTKGVSYAYQVKAFDGAGNVSAGSNVVTIIGR